MSKEQESLIKQIALELAGSMQQGRDREVSGLFRDIKSSIEGLEGDVKGLKKAVQALEADYKTNVLPNIKTWNGAADNQKRGFWTVFGVAVVALLGLIGIQ